MCCTKKESNKSLSSKIILVLVLAILVVFKLSYVLKFNPHSWFSTNVTLPYIYLVDNLNSISKKYFKDL